MISFPQCWRDERRSQGRCLQELTGIAMHNSVGQEAGARSPHPDSRTWAGVSRGGNVCAEECLQGVQVSRQSDTNRKKKKQQNFQRSRSKNSQGIVREQKVIPLSVEDYKDGSRKTRLGRGWNQDVEVQSYTGMWTSSNGGCHRDFKQGSDRIIIIFQKIHLESGELLVWPGP